MAEIDKIPAYLPPNGASDVLLDLSLTLAGQKDTREAMQIALSLPAFSRMLNILDSTFPDEKEKLRSFFHEMVDILLNSRLPQSLGHAEKTLEYAMKLDTHGVSKPALLVAAFLHDLDRCKKETRFKKSTYPDDRAHKQAHQKKAAEVVRGHMDEHRISAELSTDVERLIENHEFGVDDDSRTLMLADAISFFEYNLPFYYEQELHGRRGKRSGSTRQKMKDLFEKFHPDEYSEQRRILFETIKPLRYNREAFPGVSLNGQESEELNKIFQEEYHGAR